MLESELKQLFKDIFKVKEVSFDTPGESKEQSVLWVEIEKPKYSFKDKKEVAYVTGNAVMFGKNESLPFGFFGKAIAQAPDSLTKDLFFSEVDNNTPRLRDIVQRGFSFTYLFNSQYDPSVGTITSVDINIEES